jgi:hypothetical protein
VRGGTSTVSGRHSGYSTVQYLQNLQTVEETRDFDYLSFVTSSYLTGKTVI